MKFPSLEPKIVSNSKYRKICLEIYMRIYEECQK